MGEMSVYWVPVKADPVDLFSGNEDLQLTFSPRSVSGRSEWVLVGGTPHGLIITRDRQGWKTILDDLPEWVSSATVKDNEIILVGSDDGQFRTEVLTSDHSRGS